MSKEILSRIKEDDEEAWDYIYNPKSINFIKGIIRHTGVPEADVEDVLQTTMERVLKALRGKTIEENDNVFGYFVRSAQNCSIDYLRKRRVPTVTLNPEASYTSTSANFYEVEQADEIQDVLGELSTTEKRALILKAQGYTNVEVGSIIGKRGTAVKSLVFRAQDKVRQTYGNKINS